MASPVIAVGDRPKVFSINITLQICISCGVDQVVDGPSQGDNMGIISASGQAAGESHRS